MCGLFGAIGRGANPGIIRALAIANENRGSHSTGFFDSHHRIYKTPKSATTTLGKPSFSKWLGRAKGAWFVAGHTRHATQGSICQRNAHPFKSGNYIGSHNGIVDAPISYAVDSQYLIDLLAKHQNDYQAAFNDVWGYWGLSWTDGYDFFLQAYSNKIHLCRHKSGVWYYSSDVSHLNPAVGFSRDNYLLQDGETLRFSERSTTFDVMPRFKSTLDRIVTIDPRTQGGKSTTWNDYRRGGWGGKYGNGRKHKVQGGTASYMNGKQTFHPDPLEGYGRNSTTYDRFGDVIDDEADYLVEIDGAADNFHSAFPDGDDPYYSKAKAESDSMESTRWHHYPIDWDEKTEEECAAEYADKFGDEWETLAEDEKADLREDYRRWALGLDPIA